MMQWIKRIPWKMILGMLIFGFIFLFGMMHDEGLYSQPIYKVTHVRTLSSNKATDEFHNQDRQTDQKLTGTIMNGTHKGRKLTIDNTYSHSNAMDRKYRVGEEAFLVVHKDINRSTIKTYKRDVPVAALTYLAICLLLIFLRMSGLTALLSIVVNAVLFVLAVVINGKTEGTKVLMLFGILAVVFSTVTLFLILGFSRQMMITLASTIVGTLAALVISLLVFHLTHEHGIHYESMQYVTQLPQPLFLAESLIGSLGAVMDESTDITSSLFALVRERPLISRKQIFLSGRNIGKSIMGPLINVLFFIFMGSALPLALLFLKNGNSWGYSFTMNMSLGVVQSLISAIGIVLAVLLSSFFASLWIKSNRKAGAEA
ncbi:MAG: YibE/F family protein [Acetilactobacillus jinshanensis]